MHSINSRRYVSLICYHLGFSSIADDKMDVYPNRHWIKKMPRRLLKREIGRQGIRLLDRACAGGSLNLTDLRIYQENNFDIY